MSILYGLLIPENNCFRDAAAVVEAGLSPDPEQTQCIVSSKVEQLSFSQTLLKNIHNGSGETSISSTPQSQRASTDKSPPNTPAKQKWAVVALKDSHPDKCDPERKNSLPQSKACGKLNLLYCPCQIFGFGRQNWGCPLCALVTYYRQVGLSCIIVLDVVGVLCGSNQYIGME